MVRTRYVFPLGPYRLTGKNNNQSVRLHGHLTTGPLEPAAGTLGSTIKNTNTHTEDQPRRCVSSTAQKNGHVWSNIQERQVPIYLSEAVVEFVKMGPGPGPVSRPLTGSPCHRVNNFVARGRSHPYKAPGGYFIPTRLPSTVGPPEEPQRLLVLAWLLQGDLECDPCDPIGTLAVDGLATAKKAVNLRVVVGVWHEEGPLAVALLSSISCVRTRVLRCASLHHVPQCFSITPHRSIPESNLPHTSAHTPNSQEISAPSPPPANVQSRLTSTSKHPCSPRRRIASSANFSAKKPRSGDPGGASWAASSHSLRLNCMARPWVRACSTSTALSRATPHRHWPRPLSLSKWKNRVS